MNPSLVPLQQWYCDTCHEIIEKPSHGYLEWKRDPQPELRGRAGFRVVHHALHSPARKRGGDCYYRNSERGGDLDLPRFLGPDGLVHLSAWIDIGQEKDPDYKGPSVGDLREWTVLLRRLHVPYYEEARQYLPRALRDHFGESNEVTFYLPSTLKAIIEHYRDEDQD